MNKTQKFLGFIKRDSFFYLILLVIILLSFALLSPKISVQLFTFKRQATLNEFINDTKSYGVNPQEYWRFREFYSPGYFIFSRTGINNSLLEQTKEEIGVNYNNKNIDLTFLVFSSLQVNSLDMLTKQTDLSTLITQNYLTKENIIFMDKRSLIYKNGPKNITIVFLLNNSEMKKANGFFDYQEKDKQLTSGENWFNITSVKTD